MTLSDYQLRDTRIASYILWLRPFVRPIDEEDDIQVLVKKPTKRQQILDSL